jgi:hypothetical protein
MNIIPIIEVLIDLSICRDVTASATIIRAMDVQRSNPGPLLKKAHQAIRTRPSTAPPMSPNGAAFGRIIGMRILTRHRRIAIITPGISLNGFGLTCSLALASVFILLVLVKSKSMYLMVLQ